MLAAFLGALPNTAAAVEAPAWLNEICRVATPAYPPETEAVVLLDQLDTTVTNAGTLLSTHRRAVRVLRPSGCEEAAHLIATSAFDTKVNSMTGWNVRPAGEPRKVTMKQAIMSSLAPDILYMDVKLILLVVPEVEVGCVVGFEWQEERTPPSLEDSFEFQGRFPVLRAAYSISMPDGWNADFLWVNWNPAEASVSKGFAGGLSCEVRNAPAIGEEPRMPSVRAVAGRLVVRLKPSRPDERAFAGWAEMGAWYEKLTRDCRLPGASISWKAKELTAQASDSLLKMRALADFVQREIRYVAIEIGIGGFKPHAAPNILTNRFGDCKDKATLLASLLEAQGVTSYYLLVNVERGIVTPESPVSLYCFNHVILAIRLPDEVSDAGLTALVRHSKLGRLLIFDPTSPYTPFGRMPSYLQGNMVFLVAEGSGELFAPPLPDPESNLLDRGGRLTLKGDGSLEGEIQEVRRGSLADSYRHALQTSTASGRTKLLETRLSRSLSSFTLEDVRVENLEDNGRDLVVRYRLRVPRYAKFAGGLMIVRPRVLGNKAFSLTAPGQKPRRYPIDLDSTSLERDEFVIEVPEGYLPEELPPPADLHSGFASYKSKTEAIGRTLIYRREYRMLQPILAADRFDEAAKFQLAIAADEQQSALLKK